MANFTKNPPKYALHQVAVQGWSVLISGADEDAFESKRRESLVTKTKMNRDVSRAILKHEHFTGKRPGWDMGAFYSKIASQFCTKIGQKAIVLTIKLVQTEFLFWF